MSLNTRCSGKHAIGAVCRIWLATMLLLVSSVSTAADSKDASIVFNLKDADLDTVIATVAEFTGKNFIVDPRVKGKVTVISSRPMNASEVYQTFLSLLEVHNFSAVPVGSVIKIVPSVNAKQIGGSEMFKEDARGDEIVTRVIQVENISAAQLVPILRPLVPQYGHMAAYAATNVLIVSDTAGNVDRLLSIINRIDVASASDIEVMPLKHASAAEVVRILESLRQQGKRTDPNQAADTAVLVADERTNSILISGDKSERLGIRAIVSHLDTPLESTGNTHVVYLRYAKAVDLVPVLTGLGETFEKEKQAATGGKVAIQADRAPITIQAHEPTNALVITAPPTLFRSLQSVIAKLDMRRAQVLVEAIIAEVRDDKSGELGVSWFVDGTADGSGPIGGTVFDAFNATAAAASISNGNIPVPSAPISFLGLGRFNSGTIDFAGLIKAIQGDSRANILSKPSIMTLDNEEAEIIVGETVPFRTGTYTSTGDSSNPTNPFTTISRENVGITLKVKPQINEGDAVKLDIEQKVDSIAPTPAGAADIATNTRSIKTSVLVDDGGTIVLGGLINDDVEESEQKVPLLGDIPFLGALFRQKTTTNAKKDLMVFIRPSIVRDAAVANQVSSSKYDYIRAEQMRFKEKGVLLVNSSELPVMPEFLELPPPYKAPSGAADADPAVQPNDTNGDGE